MDVTTITRTCSAVLTVAAMTLSTGCDSGPTAPTPGADVQIRLQMSGGLVGVDYAIVVDGASSAALGEFCRHGCSFTDGETLIGLSRQQIDDWGQRLLDAGITALDGTDYGNECCDRFQVVLTYSDALGEATIRGTSDLMPADIQTIIGELSGLLNGTLPVRIDWAADPARLPADPVTVDAVSLDGSTLRLDVGYGGGCASHHFDALVYGGWMESFPVQVRLAVTHDGNDDRCDAFLHRTLSFDLGPLAREYQQAYPGEPAGDRRILVHLEIPGESVAESVTYLF